MSTNGDRNDQLGRYFVSSLRPYRMVVDRYSIGILVLCGPLLGGFVFLSLGSLASIERAGLITLLFSSLIGFRSRGLPLLGVGIRYVKYCLSLKRLRGYFFTIFVLIKGERLAGDRVGGDRFNRGPRSQRSQTGKFALIGGSLGFGGRLQSKSPLTAMHHGEDRSYIGRHRGGLFDLSHFRRLRSNGSERSPWRLLPMDGTVPAESLTNWLRRDADLEPRGDLDHRRSRRFFHSSKDQIEALAHGQPPRETLDGGADALVEEEVAEEVAEENGGYDQPKRTSANHMSDADGVFSFGLDGKGRFIFGDHKSGVGYLYSKERSRIAVIAHVNANVTPYLLGSLELGERAERFCDALDNLSTLKLAEMEIAMVTFANCTERFGGYSSNDSKKNSIGNASHHRGSSDDNPGAFSGDFIAPLRQYSPEEAEAVAAVDPDLSQGATPFDLIDQLNELDRTIISSYGGPSSFIALSARLPPFFERNFERGSSRDITDIGSNWPRNFGLNVFSSPKPGGPDNKSPLDSAGISSTSGFDSRTSSTQGRRLPRSQGAPARKDLSKAAKDQRRADLFLRDRGRSGNSRRNYSTKKSYSRWRKSPRDNSDLKREADLRLSSFLTDVAEDALVPSSSLLDGHTDCDSSTGIDLDELDEMELDEMELDEMELDPLGLACEAPPQASPMVGVKWCSFDEKRPTRSNYPIGPPNTKAKDKVFDPPATSGSSRDKNANYENLFKGDASSSKDSPGDSPKVASVAEGDDLGSRVVSSLLAKTMVDALEKLCFSSDLPQSYLVGARELIEIERYLGDGDSQCGGESERFGAISNSKGGSRIWRLRLMATSRLFPGDFLRLFRFPSSLDALVIFMRPVSKRKMANSIRSQRAKGTAGLMASRDRGFIANRTKDMRAVGLDDLDIDLLNGHVGYEYSCLFIESQNPKGRRPIGETFEAMSMSVALEVGKQAELINRIRSFSFF